MIIRAVVAVVSLLKGGTLGVGGSDDKAGQSFVIVVVEHTCYFTSKGNQNYHSILTICLQCLQSLLQLNGDSRFVTL